MKELNNYQFKGNIFCDMPFVKNSLGKNFQRKKSCGKILKHKAKIIK